MMAKMVWRTNDFKEVRKKYYWESWEDYSEHVKLHDSRIYGDPMPTVWFTKEQLAGMGMVGLYDIVFVSDNNQGNE
jgi:hypothetical protein